MKTRDFFRMTIKLFGLFWLIRMVFYILPSKIDFPLYGLDPRIFMEPLPIAVVLIGLYLVLIKLTDSIIDWMKLDQGFEEGRINLGSLDERKILSLAIIIIGGFLIVDHFPNFLHNGYISFKTMMNTRGTYDLYGLDVQKVEYFDWAISTMNIMLGYLLIVHHNRVSKWLASKLEDKKVGQ